MIRNSWRISPIHSWFAFYDIAEPGHAGGQGMNKMQRSDVPSKRRPMKNLPHIIREDLLKPCRHLRAPFAA
jgi:hypothetical protein